MKASKRPRSQTRYAAVASGAKREAKHPDPVEHAKSLGYSEEELSAVPVEAVMSLGCGNAVARAGLREGEIVLDLGNLRCVFVTLRL